MSSSYASSSKTYDVFISFRGEDTRSNFTSHLHTALSDKQIETYIDYKLNKGNDVWPALSKAIEDSDVSIVIFSENYATSKWCLKELVKILQCRKDDGQVVIPVFYQVDPSHIRKQTGNYGEAFAKHERDLVENEKNQRKVSKWKTALTEAANISGWDSRTYRDDSQLIQNIVNDVLQKMHLRHPDELEGLVRIDEQCRHIESILEEARVIGIWGMGGIGKTTIAKAIFAKHFPQYDSVCFLANVREQSIKLGLTYLRDKLLSTLLNEEVPTSNDVGSTFIKRRVRSKKVFLVLDDVDTFEQLEYLCGECGDLGPNSKLIVTTRYKHLLTGRADEIYAVRTWEYLQSLHLFSLYAFKEIHPQKGYEDLSARAVDYAGGIPLALKVLGSYLYNKSNEFWESALSKLQKYPNEKIQNVLQVSYDGLDKLEKDIFLDIAFFFKEEDKDVVIRILDACGFYAASGIDVLVDKALIAISNINRIKIHDLLQEMGLEIVRQQCGGDLGRCSRLRDTEEVCDLLENNKGTDAVEGITLDLSQIEDLQLSADTFNKMKNLRYLEFQNPLGRTSGVVNLPIALKPFSDKLRYFEWNGYPLKSLPPNFCAKFLVSIRMSHSNVKELWQGVQDLVNLVGIDLRGCKQLTRLPDLSRASKLMVVDLFNCESLCDLHPSVLSLDSLIVLMLDGCIKLRSLKSERHLRSLQILRVDGCLSLKEFSVSSNLIRSLDLTKTGVKILHSSIGRLTNLNSLNLEGLGLKNLPDELCCLTLLMDLKISDCIAIDKQKLHVLFDSLRSLKVLYLKYCYKLFELPDNISLLSMLHELRLDGSCVEMLPATIRHLQELEILSLEYCRKLQCLPELPPSIKELHANNCTSLVTVSLPIAKCVKPDEHLCNGILGSSVDRLPRLRSLKELEVHNCQELQTLQKFQLSNKSFYAGGCLSLAMLSTHSAEICDLRIDGFRFSFKNCVKLDGHSLNSIVEEAMIVAFLSLLSPEHTCARFCMSGSRVPRQFTYRTTQSFINIESPSVPYLVGFMLSVVLSSPPLTHKTECKIICKCGLANSTNVKIEYPFTADFSSNHVFVWFYPIDNFSIGGGTVSFEFSVIGRHDGLIVMKECGVRLIYVLEIFSFLRELEWTWDNKVQFGVQFGLGIDMQYQHWKEIMCGKCFLLLQLLMKWNASSIFEFLSGCTAILTAIKKESEKSNGIVPESLSVLGELEMEFDKKVELGLKLGLALDMKQVDREIKDCQSRESECQAFFKAIVNVAQKSNEFVLESHSFSGELELGFDKKVMLGVSLGLMLDKELIRLNRERLNRLLNHVLTNGSEWEESLKLEFESRRRAILAKIEEETQQSNEFVFPSATTRIWKNRTQGLKDLVSLFP